MSTTPIFITEELRLVTTTAVLNDRYSKVTAYTVLAYSVFKTRMDAKVPSTDDTN